MDKKAAEGSWKNKTRIFRFISQRGRTSKLELVSQLGISLPTVLQNLKELTEEGLIWEKGEFESTGGRKAKALALVRGSRFALGIDITKNHVSLVLADLSGQIIRHSRVSKTFARNAGYGESLGALVNDHLQQWRIPEEQFLGVGVSVPGIVDAQGKVIMDSHALEVRKMPCEEIAKFIGYSCLFINDANAAGFAELREENAINGAVGNAVYLSLSNSVGGAFLQGRRLYLGENQRSGEFGHMTLYPGGRECYCGKKGCVDAYCSAQRLSSLTGGKLGLFFEKIRHKDPAYLPAWEEYQRYLAIAANNLHMAFDCDVILGGYVGSYLEEWIGPLRELAAEQNPFDDGGTYLRVCRYRVEAAALGAALQHVDRFIEGL